MRLHTLLSFFISLFLIVSGSDWDFVGICMGSEWEGAVSAALGMAVQSRLYCGI